MLTTMTPREKMQAALDKLFDLSAPDPRRARTERERLELVGIARAHETAVPFFSLGQAFAEFGGDPIRLEIRRERITEEINSATFALALGNTLGRRLVADYKTLDYGEELIISFKKPVKDLKGQSGNIVGYYGDLSDADPEAGDYGEFAALDEDEAPYSMNQKGNILTVTRRAVINDDLGLIRRLLARATRAARRTHARFCWAPIINNSVIYDGSPLFDAARGNLGADQLNDSGVQAGITAIRGQTELNSGERIQFGGIFHLWVPLQLEFTADKIRPAGAARDRGDPEETSNVARVIPHVNSLFTNAENWALTAEPTDCELLEMSYVDGREEPEVMLEDHPKATMMFVRDALQYKVRHEYGGAIVEFRGAYKSVRS